MTNQAKSEWAVADKVVVRGIAISQLLFCVFFLGMTPFLFNYGGASAHPNRFNAYLLVMTCGLASAVFLLSAQLTARLVSATWQVTVVGLLWWSFAHRPTPVRDPTMPELAVRNPASTPSPGFTLFWAVLGLVAAYLVLTSAVQFFDRRRKQVGIDK